MTKFLPSVYTVVFIVSLPLNIMAIIIFLVKMKIRKPAVVYMLNLAVADVLFASTLPFKIIYHFSGNNWIFGSGICSFVAETFYCNMYCSILLITAISVDRFLGVVFPIQSLSWRTVRRSWMVCILIWVISIATTVPLFTTEQPKHIAELNITTCHDVVDVNKKELFYVFYFSTFCFVFFFIPLIFTTIAYIGIIHTLRFSTFGNALKRRQAVFLSVIVFCIFVMCFGPTNVIFLSNYLYLLNGIVNEYLYFAYILCVCIGSISCCLDPLIYYYVSPECQIYLYQLLSGKDTTSLSRTKALLEK
ncbi:proteinase-activated receptor 1-like [Pelobates fuscus]|uniref:proteinase-activated receptor 1-like n=1 Tax=Pelobates fuscus TaxID=191477 RepID=UPI002FE46E84